MPTMSLTVKGMHCKSCEMLIEDSVKDIEGVTEVAVSWPNESVKVTFEGNIGRDKIAAVIKEEGYEVV